MNTVFRTYFTLLLIALTLEVTGCKYIPELDDPNNNPSPSPTVSASESPTANPTVNPTVMPTIKPSPTAIPENPIATSTQNFIDGLKIGNIWKPVSDTSGNLVVVFASKWKKFKDGCFVETKTGKKEELFCDDNGFYKCFGNPDKSGPRLHLRSKIKCSQAKQVKVICYEAKQQVTFTVENSKLNDVCSRHD